MGASSKPLLFNVYITIFIYLKELIHRVKDLESALLSSKTDNARNPVSVHKYVES
jgi:hypothetical protein